jgi:hypothetical protein
MPSIHWGSHVVDQNSKMCSDSSLLECPLTEQEVGGSNHGRVMYISGTLVGDVDDLCQISRSP